MQSRQSPFRSLLISLVRSLPPSTVHNNCIIPKSEDFFINQLGILVSVSCCYVYRAGFKTVGAPGQDIFRGEM